MVIEKLKTRYQQWRDRRFLKKHGCDDWEQYHHRFDPSIFRRADTVRQFYSGYPYLHCFTDHIQDMVYIGDWYQGMGIVRQWATENCKGKFRCDLHSMTMTDGKAPPTLDGWKFDYCFGGDFCFFAFELEEDAIWFKLRWG